MKTYIWTLPTRIFHWLLAISFALAFILGGEEDFLRLHIALGSFAGVLVLFRIIQGFNGPLYARFRDFPVSVKALTLFFTNMKMSRSEHPGHNPMASVIMLSILLVALISAISGILLSASEGTGIFGITLSVSYKETFEELHDVVVHLMLILVVIHLTGILADTVLHYAQGTLFSMFTGYKNIKAENASLTPAQKVFSIFWILLPLLTFFYIMLYQPVPKGDKEKTEEVKEKGESDD
ncbi:MAG: cytochrome b/b6 domain-containing protein [Bacteroidales bacterium]